LYTGFKRDKSEIRVSRSKLLTLFPSPSLPPRPLTPRSLPPPPPPSPSPSPEGLASITSITSLSLKPPIPPLSSALRSFPPCPQTAPARPPSNAVGTLSIAHTPSRVIGAMCVGVGAAIGPVPTPA
ncbi:hypothetical protein Vafri_1771, partial [Volvox africanus]